MKILIIGSGAREYSLGLALKKDKNVDELYFIPGNGASQNLGTNIYINSNEEIANFAKKNNIDLTIVGPEKPLVDGIVDIFKEKNLKIFGPSKMAAKLEGSKAFMKDFLKKYNIPTAKYIQTDKQEEAYEFIDNMQTPIVVKADGLCAGKGVIITQSKEEAKETVDNMLSGKSFNKAGRRVVIEEFLNGYEISLFAICDGENYVLLPASQDHKKLLDDDKGVNTGGMGAYAPVPFIPKELIAYSEKYIIKPTLKGMQENKTPFTGVLFIGLMVVGDKAKVLEYNVRFGDPECSVLLPLIKTPLTQIFTKTIEGNLDSLNIEFLKKYCVAVVLASKNYPYSSSNEEEIDIKENNTKDTLLSYAGVKKDKSILISSGGRIILSIGMGDKVKEAKDKAYELIKYINFKGKKYRKDIAKQAVEYEKRN